MLKNNILGCCCLLFCLRSFVLSNLSPVLVWGSNSTYYLSKNTTSVNQVLLYALQQHMVVIYLEDNLKSRDIECLVPETKRYCYKYLIQNTPTVYYEAAENVLNMLSVFNTTYNELYATGGMKFPLVCKKGQVHVFSFQQDHNKHLERAKKLRLHDLLMSILSRRLRHCPTVFAYMSSPHLKRQKKQAAGKAEVATNVAAKAAAPTPTPSSNEDGMESSTSGLNGAGNDTYDDDDYILYHDDRFAFSYRELKHIKTLLELDEQGNEKKEETILQVNKMDTVTTTEGSLNVTLALDNSETITFDVIQRPGNSHLLTKFKYQSNSYKTSILEAALDDPQYWSYALHKVIFVYRWNDDASEKSRGIFNKEYIIWKDFQFQYTISSKSKATAAGTEPEDEDEEENETETEADNADNNAANKTKSLNQNETSNFKYYKAWHGESYVTHGMLMCFIISAMLIAIGTIGFMALMNIRNVNHYEDPLAPAFTIDPLTMH